MCEFFIFVNSKYFVLRQSNTDKVKTLVAGGLIVSLLGAATYLSFLADPMKGIN
jgi:hypothetical protein